MGVQHLNSHCVCKCKWKYTLIANNSSCSRQERTKKKRRKEIPENTHENSFANQTNERVNENKKKTGIEENRRVDIGRCDFEIYPFSDRNADNWNASTQASAQVCWRPDFLTPSTTIKHFILICSINWLLSARTALNSDVNLQFRIRFLVFQTRNLPLHPWEHPYLIIQCDTNIVSFFSRIVSNKLLSTSFFKNLFCFLDICSVDLLCENHKHTK